MIKLYDINPQNQEMLAQALVKNEGYTEEEAKARVDRWVKEKPKNKGAVISRIEIKTVYTDTTKHSGMLRVNKSGKPEFRVIEGHEIDSHWHYPVIDEQPLSLPPKEKWISQGQYVTNTLNRRKSNRALVQNKKG